MNNDITPIQRVAEFIRYAVASGLVKNQTEFEKRCGLTCNYVTLALRRSKLNGNVGAIVLGRIAMAFPDINLNWVCTGVGDMLRSVSSDSDYYRQAYEGAMLQVQALNSLLKDK